MSWQLARGGLDIELCSRCAVFLLRCHTNRITHTASLTGEIASLQGVLREGVGGYRTLVGTNIAALRYMNKALADRKSAHTIGYDQLFTPMSAAGTAGTGAGAGNSQNRDKNKGGKNKKRHASGTSATSQSQSQSQAAKRSRK